MNVNPRHSTRKAATAALALLVFVSALAQPANAQLDQWGYWVNGLTESWWLSSDDFTKEDAVNAVARWRQLEEARGKSPGGEWAGDYALGSDTHGAYLRWSPGAGFVIARVDKCRAQVMGLTYGQVPAATPSLVEFTPVFDKAAAHGHGAAHGPAPRALRFVPVKWGGRRLLVREEEMGRFGDYVAGLGDYNGSANRYSGDVRWFKQRGGATEEEGAVDDGRAASPSVVPARYASLIKRPIGARSTAVGRGHRKAHPADERWDQLFIPVRISAGGGQGVRRGMKFRAPGLKDPGGWTDEEVEVRSVGPR